MRAQRNSRTPARRFETIGGPVHLRRLAFVVAMVAAAYCQSNAAMADGDAIAVIPTGVPTIGGSPDYPPQIVNFSASKASGNFWVVSGIVIDDDMADITIQLGGSIPGAIIHPAADGSFSYGFYLAPGQYAYIAALAIEDDGERSQPAETYVVGY